MFTLLVLRNMVEQRLLVGKAFVAAARQESVYKSTREEGTYCT